MDKLKISIISNESDRQVDTVEINDPREAFCRLWNEIHRDTRAEPIIQSQEPPA